MRQLSRLLEQCHSMFSGSLAFLAEAGRFPKVHANVASMPVNVLCATLNAMTTEVYAANLMKKSATMSSAKTALITHAAHDALNSPDAQLLALLTLGKVRFRCSWFEIFYGTLPFAAWAALAAAAFFVGEVAPQLAAFLAFLEASSMVSASGAPSVQPIYLELRKFLAAASTLDFDFSVKTVFLAVVAKVERVGANFSSTWDPLFLKILLARKAEEHNEEVPMAVLQTLASDLGAYAASDALLQSLRSIEADPVRRVVAAHAVRFDEDAADREGDRPLALAPPRHGGADRRLRPQRPTLPSGPGLLQMRGHRRGRVRLPGVLRHLASAPDVLRHLPLPDPQIPI